MAIKDWPGGVISKTPVVPSGGYINSTASGVWTLDQAAYWTKQQQWPGTAVGDPYFYDVSLLLTGDGTNGAQNNTFLDSSTNNFTITRNGNATQGTFSPYGNLWSNYFDGSGDYLNIAENAAFGFGTGDFSLEFWAFIVDYSRNNTILDTRTGGSGLVIGMFPNGAVNVYAAGDRTTASGLYPSNQWVHIAVTRSGTTLRTFINGVMQGYFTSISTDFGSSNVIRIGYQTDNANYCYGYISNLRIIKGSIPASYQTSATSTGTSVFTPSTTPLTAISGTSLLTCQSNRFIDNSSNNFTLTVNGNTSVQRFSPFNPTAPYSAATIGGSGYFDGSGDYLKIPDNAAVQLGTSQFWYEAWIYVTTLPTTGSYIVLGGTTNGAMTVRIRASALRVDLLNVGSWDSTSVTWQKGAWQHIAVGRDSGNTLRFFVNGEAKGTATLTNSCDGYSNSLGVNPSELSEYFPGYLCDSRLIKGSCLYTTSFTPPTAPVTVVTNTSWLCNFTNAGIPDAAMMNDLETVGNAQVSTSVKKYGTGSLAFDGSGDYITAPTSPNLGIGSGNFTIEFWLYANTVSGYQTVLDLRTSQPSAGPSIYFANNSRLNYLFNSGTAYAFGPNPFLANTWYHVAWVRSGTTHTLYVDGQSQATFTDSAGLTSSPLAIGARQAGGYADYFNGYIDDLRITKGYARYTANFTPPTAAFPTF